MSTVNGRGKGVRKRNLLRNSMDSSMNVQILVEFWFLFFYLIICIALSFVIFVSGRSCTWLV